MKPATLVLIALLLVLPAVSGATTIKLKTLPGHDVSISIWNTDFTVIYSAPEKYLSDIYGDVTHIYEGTQSSFGVMVVVEAFDVKKYREQFPGPYAAGETIQLPNLFPEDYTPPEYDDEEPPAEPEEPQNQTEEIQEDIQDNQEDTILASAIASNGSVFNDGNYQIVYYTVGGIFILGVIAAIVVFLISKLKAPKTIQYGMEPVKLNVKYKSSSSTDRDLDVIEKEIEDVERQIEQYKKRNRLDDAQRRLEEKKKMLERLKKEEHHTSSPSHHRSEEHSRYKKRFY